MKQRILNSETLRGLWGCHLVFSAFIILFLMLVADWIGWIITFGQHSGGELVARLGREDETEEKK